MKHIFFLFYVGEYHTIWKQDSKGFYAKNPYIK